MIPQIVSLLVVTHLLADFVLQDKNWAETKWKSIDSLLTHVAVYTVVMFLFILFYEGTNNSGAAITFGVLTYFLHLITDFSSSKLLHIYAEKQKWGSHIPNWGFFTVLGIDQTLHMLALFWAYNFAYH